MKPQETISVQIEGKRYVVTFVYYPPEPSSMYAPGAPEEFEIISCVDDEGAEHTGEIDEFDKAFYCALDERKNKDKYENFIEPFDLDDFPFRY
jgi:hypothetical protein